MIYKDLILLHLSDVTKHFFLINNHYQIQIMSLNYHWNMLCYRISIVMMFDAINIYFEILHSNVVLRQNKLRHVCVRNNGSRFTELPLLRNIYSSKMQTNLLHIWQVEC